MSELFCSHAAPKYDNIAGIQPVLGELGHVLLGRLFHLLLDLIFDLFNHSFKLALGVVKVDFSAEAKVLQGETVINAGSQILIG